MNLSNYSGQCHQFRKALLFMILATLPILHLSAQDKSGFRESYVDHLFQSDAKPKKREFLRPTTTFQKINPLFYFGSGALFFYQNVISEQLQANCQYEISCSEIARLSIRKFGTIKGVFIGIDQLNSCVPNVFLEHDRHFISNEFKVKNEIKLDHN